MVGKLAQQLCPGTSDGQISNRILSHKSQIFTCQDLHL